MGAVMGLQEAFLGDIAEHPYDDAPRLAYADWLMEHADPALAARGEYIALQCRMLAAEGEERKRMKARARALLRRHRGAWLEGVAQLGGLEYTRGLVERARLSWAGTGSHRDYLEAVSDLFRREPAIRHLHLEHLDLGGSLFADILNLANLPSLLTLSVGEGATPQEPIGIVTRSSRLVGLRRLIVLSDRVGPRANLGPLATSPFRQTLEALRVFGRGLERGGVAALTASMWPRLMYLDLSGNSISTECLRQLGTGSAFPALQSLILSNIGLGWESARDLSGSPFISRLRALTLWDGGLGLGTDELEALIATLLGRGLKCLTLPDSYAIGEGTRQDLVRRYGDRVRIECSRWW